MTSERNVFPNVKHAPLHEVFPGIMGRAFWGENMLCLTVTLEPNAVLPPHSHPHEQGGIVLEGEIEFTVDGETRRLTAGDGYMIPGGATHSARIGPDGCRVLDVFSPVREEYKRFGA